MAFLCPHSFQQLARISHGDPTLRPTNYEFDENQMISKIAKMV